MKYKPLHDSLTIKKSHIEGLGIFAYKQIPKNTLLGITHIKSKNVGSYFPQDIIRTPLGGFLNHSEEPNCFIKQKEFIWELVTKKMIEENDEILIKYFPDFMNF